VPIADDAIVAADVGIAHPNLVNLLHTRITLREGVRRLAADYLRAAPGGTEKLAERTHKVNWTDVEGRPAPATL
jgi:hypothetical protein